MADEQRDLENSKSEEPEKAKRERSPSFPFISLPRAIERVKTFEANHKRNATRVALAAQTWGYGFKSSAAQQTIAALKAFGLIEDTSGGNDRKVQLTDLAIRILRDSRPGIRESAIRDAARRPKLFAEYADRWCSDRPSDDHRISELHLDRGFAHDAARNFIRVFDETMSFAALDKPDRQAELRFDNSSVDQIDEQDTRSFQGSQRDHPHLSESAESAPKRLTERATFPLPEGLVALDVPTKLSQASYEDLEAWLQVILRRIKRSVHPAD